MPHIGDVDMNKQIHNPCIVLFVNSPIKSVAKLFVSGPFLVWIE